MSESTSAGGPTKGSPRQKKSGGSQKPPQGKKRGPAKGKPQAKKSPAKKTIKGTFFNVSGEIQASSTSANIEGDGPLYTTDLVVDKNKNSFGKAAIELDVNGERRVVVMDAEQVELLLKLLGVVKVDG